jgi:hypothetical protein
MAGGWPILPEFSNANDQGTVLSVSSGTLVTSSSTAKTKGAYTQLVASTPYDAIGFLLIVNVTPITTGVSAITVDIAIGPSGSELNILTDFYIPNVGIQETNDVMIYLPCLIPAGTRISSRVAGLQASKSATISLVMFDSDFIDVDTSSTYDTLGFSEANLNGTAVTNSSTVNQKGAFTTIVSATSYDYSGFVVVFDARNTSNSNAPINLLVDIAIGPAGSEVVILPNLQITIKSPTNSSASPTNTPFLPIPIPAGLRVSARTSGAVASTALGVTIIAARF